MKKALISTNEILNNGLRIAQVVLSGEEFQVAEGLFWADCPEYVTAESYYYTQSQEFSLIPTPPVLPTPIPTEISMRQARLALLQEGLLSQVNTVIAGLPEAQRLAAEIEWEYATTVKRGSPLVLAIASALELTEENVDELFVTAANIGDN